MLSGEGAVPKQGRKGCGLLQKLLAAAFLLAGHPLGAPSLLRASSLRVAKGQRPSLIYVALKCKWISPGEPLCSVDLLPRFEEEAVYIALWLRRNWVLGKDFLTLCFKTAFHSTI